MPSVEDGVKDGVKDGVEVGRGDIIEASRLVEGRYSHADAVPCLSQFPQLGLCSSHLGLSASASIARTKRRTLTWRVLHGKHPFLDFL